MGDPDCHQDQTLFQPAPRPWRRAGGWACITQPTTLTQRWDTQTPGGPSVCPTRAAHVGSRAGHPQRGLQGPGGPRRQGGPGRGRPHMPPSSLPRPEAQTRPSHSFSREDWGVLHAPGPACPRKSEAPDSRASAACTSGPRGEASRAQATGLGRARASDSHVLLPSGRPPPGGRGRRRGPRPGARARGRSQPADPHGAQAGTVTVPSAGIGNRTDILSHPPIVTRLLGDTV